MSRWRKLAFGMSAIPDQMTYQAFTLLAFVFYFGVAGLNMIQLWIGFTIWAIWNAFNDPLFGGLSDRTRFDFTQRFGKRRFYIVLSIIPLGLMMIFLFTPPTLDNNMVNFIYFLVIINVFEAIYTIYSVNVNALFPEMWTAEERTSTNLYVKGLTVLALMIGVVMPTLILPAFTPSPPITTPGDLAPYYLFVGVIIGILTIVSAVPFIFYGIQEKPEFKQDVHKSPSFFSAAKITLKNKTFLIFVFGNLLIWFVFGLLVTIVPLYAQFVVYIEGTILVGLPLMLAFLLTVVCFPLHKKIAHKFGLRKGMILTLAVWVGTLIPYFFLGAGSTTAFFIITSLQGFPLAGAMYFVDLLISDVIDEDETKTGVRREGSYYGMNAFVHRFSVILKITAIAIVFTNVNWVVFSNIADPGATDPALISFGLKALMVIFPVIALAIATLIFKFYPLHGEALAKMRIKLDEIHQEKKKLITN